MGSRKDDLKEDARFRVLRLLEAHPEISQRKLAGKVGVSTGSIHYLLHTLVKRGLVEVENFEASSGRRRYAYILTPKGIAEKIGVAGPFLARKIAEHKVLKDEIAELEFELRQAEKSSRGGRP